MATSVKYAVLSMKVVVSRKYLMLEKSRYNTNLNRLFRFGWILWILNNIPLQVEVEMTEPRTAPALRPALTALLQCFWTSWRTVKLSMQMSS